jgi:adenine-specific DNA glycosylase
MALVEHAGRVLLTRNPPGEMMGGLYELPHSGMPRKDERLPSLAERYPGVVAKVGGTPIVVRHAVTHHRIEATIRRSTLTRKRAPRDCAFHTLTEAWSLPLGGLTRKALRAAGLGAS